MPCTVIILFFSFRQQNCTVRVTKTGWFGIKIQTFTTFSLCYNNVPGRKPWRLTSPKCRWNRKEKKRQRGSETKTKERRAAIKTSGCRGEERKEWERLEKERRLPLCKSMLTLAAAERNIKAASVTHTNTSDHPESLFIVFKHWPNNVGLNTHKHFREEWRWLHGFLGWFFFVAQFCWLQSVCFELFPTCRVHVCLLPSHLYCKGVHVPVPFDPRSCALSGFQACLHCAPFVSGSFV